jgi:hypothetical protein
VNISKNKFICYTDGFVKNIGIIDISLTFKTNIYDENFNSIAEFYSLIKNNILVVKVELLGIFSSIIIISPNSEVLIYTDCEININMFYKLRN